MESTSSLKEGDRVLFKDGYQFREGKIMEISPSRTYVKFQYLYMEFYITNWFEIELTQELLEE